MKNSNPFQLFVKLASAFLLSTALVACNKESNENSETPATGPAPHVVEQGLVGAVFGGVSVNDISISTAGFTDQYKQTAIQSNQYFALGSNGKSITAILAAKMVEAGLVQWNSRILDVLPELKDKIRADYIEVTLEQLLDHQSGLLPLTSPDEADGYDGDFPEDAWQRRLAAITWMLNQQPVATPGTDFHYSNAGYTVAGAMLEKLGKDTYLNLVNQWVLAPLNISVIMTMPATKFDKQPIGYLGEKYHLVRVNPQDATLLLLDDIISPAGSLCMTAKDYAKYLQWHLLALSGKNTPLPFSYIDKLQKLTDGEYTLGWSLKKNSQNDNAILMHLGETDGFTTFAVLDSKGAAGAFSLTNTASDNDSNPWVSTLLIESTINLYAQISGR